MTTESITPLWDRTSAGADGRSVQGRAPCVGKERVISRSGGPWLYVERAIMLIARFAACVFPAERDFKW
jgi:hypothetical protein